MHLSAPTPQSFRCTAGATTEAEVITTDGVEAITTGGPTIVIGEASLANDHDSRESRQSGGFFFATVRIGGTDWPDDKHQCGSTGRSATNKLS
jgi:hypothetical protein